CTTKAPTRTGRVDGPSAYIRPLMTFAKDRLTHLTIENRALLEERLLRPVQPSPGASSALDAPKPLGFAQESLWFFDRLVPNSPLYNIPQAFRLQGPLNRGALAQALHEVITRHGALRTRCVIEQGVPFQKARSEPFGMGVTDLESLSVAERERQVARI